MIYAYFMGNSANQISRIKEEIYLFAKLQKWEPADIFIDFSAKPFKERISYQEVKKKLSAKNILIITELSQLGKNKKDILEELKYFRSKKIRLVVMDIPATYPDVSFMTKDTKDLVLSSIIDTMIDLYKTMVFTEIDLMKKKQLEGIERKRRKNNGVYGRPKTKIPSNWQIVMDDLKNHKITSKEAMLRTGLKKTTFYKLMKETN